MGAHIATGEVTALNHEVADDAVKSRASVAIAVGVGAQLPEVAGSLGDNVVIKR